MNEIFYLCIDYIYYKIQMTLQQLKYIVAIDRQADLRMRPIIIQDGRKKSNKGREA